MATECLVRNVIDIFFQENHTPYTESHSFLCRTHAFIYSREKYTLTFENFLTYDSITACQYHVVHFATNIRSNT